MTTLAILAKKTSRAKPLILPTVGSTSAKNLGMFKLLLFGYIRNFGPSTPGGISIPKRLYNQLSCALLLMLLTITSNSLLVTVRSININLSLFLMI